MRTVWIPGSRVRGRGPRVAAEHLRRGRSPWSRVLASAWLTGLLRAACSEWLEVLGVAWGHLSTRPPHPARCPGNLVQPRPPPRRPTSRSLRLPSGIWDPRVQLSGTFPPRQKPQGIHPCPWRPSFLSDPSRFPSIRQPKHGCVPCALSLVPPRVPPARRPCHPCWNPPPPSQNTA